MNNIKVLKEIQKIILQESNKKLNEASLSQIQRDLEEGTSSYCLISASRDEYFNKFLVGKSKKEATELMEQDLQKMGLGYTRVQGMYTYSNGFIDVESSFYIKNIKFGDAIKLSEKYEQESVLYFDENICGFWKTNPPKAKYDIDTPDKYIFDRKLKFSPTYTGYASTSVKRSKKDQQKFGLASEFDRGGHFKNLRTKAETGDPEAIEEFESQKTVARDIRNHRRNVGVKKYKRNRGMF